MALFSRCPPVPSSAVVAFIPDVDVKVNASTFLGSKTLYTLPPLYVPTASFPNISSMLMSVLIVSATFHVTAMYPLTTTVNVVISNCETRNNR